jgi:hypothetical protein
VPKKLFNSFGQVVETLYGTCAGHNSDPTNNKTIRTKSLFTLLILIVNFVALMCVLYQCYKAQQLATEFCKAFYVGMSVVLMCEVSLVTVLILILTQDNPLSAFVMTSYNILSFIGLTILLPMYVPKYVQQHVLCTTDLTGVETWQRQWDSVAKAARNTGY